MALTDEDLMSAYADGDLQAFEVLYHRHKGKIFGYLLARLKNRDEAEEVFQQLFARLHQGRAHYRPEIPFLPWIFTISRNVMVDHLRKQQVYRHHVTTSEELVAAAADVRPHQPAGSLGLPELAALTASQRKALELRFVEELTFGEIADQLQTSAVNARQILSRGMRRLRQTIPAKGRKI
ncbi:MAG: sigma-70 family RNA polymerase sigma factor [Desulfuromonadales bacterium]|nr:sigma-70 family RNA polymerase sigma factor [Desulfuromonadales bacterium]